MIEAARAAGHEPLAEWTAPDLDPAARQALAAWETLIGDRVGPSHAISFLAIDRWALRHAVEGDAFEFLVRAIRAADDALAAYEAEAAPKPPQTPQGPPS